MDRRKFLAGMVVTGTAISLPISESIASVSKPIVPLDQSLLFHKNDGPIGYMLKTIRDVETYYMEANTGGIGINSSLHKVKDEIPNKNVKMAFRIEKFQSDKTFKFTDADELDQYYFNNCGVRNVDFVLSNDEVKLNLFEIEKVANQIAKDTRMGKGNNIILSEENSNYFSKYIKDGILNGRYHIHVRPWVMNNEILVFYRRKPNTGIYKEQYDVPGLVFNDGGIALNQDFKYAQKIVFKG